MFEKFGKRLGDLTRAGVAAGAMVSAVPDLPAQAALTPNTIRDIADANAEDAARKEMLEEDRSRTEALADEFAAFQEMIHHLGTKGAFKDVDPDIHRVVRECINILGTDVVQRRHESAVAAIADSERFQQVVEGQFLLEKPDRFDDVKAALAEFAHHISDLARGFLTGAGDSGAKQQPNTKN